MRVDIAKELDAGVSAISVSNHGGNNLDGTASVGLPAVSAAVGDPGGVARRRHQRTQRHLRQGGGARRARPMIDRAYLWNGANGKQVK